MIVLLGVLQLADISSPQAAPRLTTEEKTLLKDREVVVRTSEREDGGENLLAVIDVDGAPGATLDAVLDVEARASEVSVLQAVSLYEDTSTLIGATYDYALAGLSGSFHVLYDIDRPRGFTWYRLDTSKTSDIDTPEGSYQVYPRGAMSRLVYRVEIKGSGWTPAWVHKALVARNLPEQLKGIRDRAESD